VFLSFLSHSSYDLCASLRLRDLGESEGTIGLFWALGTFAEIFMMYGARTTIERWGPGRMLSLALVVHALRWTFLGQATNRTLILALQPLHAVTFALMWLSLMAALKKQLGVRGTATGQGLLAAGVAAGNTCGMWLWGLFYDRAGSELVFRSATVAALLGAACAVVLQRVSSREPRPEAVSNRA
jgi:PPP family 3-phenylpropionic acid transporter